MAAARWRLRPPISSGRLHRRPPPPRCRLASATRCLRLRRRCHRCRRHRHRPRSRPATDGPRTTGLCGLDSFQPRPPRPDAISRPRPHPPPHYPPLRHRRSHPPRCLLRDLRRTARRVADAPIGEAEGARGVNCDEVCFCHACPALDRVRVDGCSLAAPLHRSAVGPLTYSRTCSLSSRAAPHAPRVPVRSTTVKIYEHRTIHRRRHFTQSARVKIHSRCFFSQCAHTKIYLRRPFSKIHRRSN